MDAFGELVQKVFKKKLMKKEINCFNNFFYIFNENPVNFFLK